MGRANMLRTVALCLLVWARETSGSAPRSLPAPCTDFYLPCNVSYHNVATLGIVARETLSKTRQDIDVLQSLTANEYFGMNLGGEFPGPSFVDRMETVRAHVAQYLGCFLNETVMFPSTTLALNAVATGLVESGFLAHDDRVLTTDQEHAGGIAGWVHYSGDEADPETALSPVVHLDRIPLPIPDLRLTEEIVADFKAHLQKNKNTKVLAISHVTTTTGAALPIKEIAAMAHSIGVIVVIDGAQAFGMKVDVTDLGVDVYASSAHKWLLAPTGNGIMCIKERLQPHVKATVFDGGFSSYTRTAGTRPADTTLGLGHALDYLDSYDHSLIVAHSLKLANRAWELFEKNGFIMLSKQPTQERLQSSAPIVSVSWKNQAITALEIGKVAFHKYGIVVKMTGRKQFPGEWPVGAPSEALRFTFHMFNDEEDVNTLVKGITSILKDHPLN